MAEGGKTVEQIQYSVLNESTEHGQQVPASAVALVLG
jgi:hypothetical protein